MGLVAVNLFVLKQVELWGDYGDVLISGFYRREKTDSAVLLHRAGPFLPPISFPYSPSGEVLVVSEVLKSELEAIAGGQVRFRKAIFETIIPVDWHTWDRNAPKPMSRPFGGEPENYLMDQRHSEETARKMVPAWEVVLDSFPVVFAHWLDSDNGVLNSAQDILLVDDLPDAGFFRSPFGGPPIVDEMTRNWLQARVSEWVSFHPLKVVTAPGAVQRLESQRARYALAAPHLTSDEYRARAMSLGEAKTFVVPPALRRPDRTVSRYCVVIGDRIPRKLSATTYDSFAALADYLEGCRRRHADVEDPLASIQIYDLETGKRLRYLGGQQFTNVDD